MGERKTPPRQQDSGGAHSEPQGIPRVAYLGFCERSVEITEGHPASWHTNVLGLSNSRISHVYPLSLQGQKYAVAVYGVRVGEEFKLIFRRTDKRQPLELTIRIMEAETLAVKNCQERVNCCSEARRGNPNPRLDFYCPDHTRRLSDPRTRHLRGFRGRHRCRMLTWVRKLPSCCGATFHRRGHCRNS